MYSYKNTNQCKWGGYDQGLYKPLYITLSVVQDNSNFDHCSFYWHFQMGSDSSNSNADFLDLE